MTDILPASPDQGCAADVKNMTHAQMHAHHQQVMPCSFENSGQAFQSGSQVHASRLADRQSQLLKHCTSLRPIMVALMSCLDSLSVCQASCIVKTLGG